MRRLRTREFEVLLVKGRQVQFCLLVNGMKPSDPSVDPHAVDILRQMSDLAADSGAQLLLYSHQGSWIERIEDSMRAPLTRPCSRRRIRRRSASGDIHST